MLKEAKLLMSPIPEQATSYRLFKGSIMAADSEKAYTTGLLQDCQTPSLELIPIWTIKHGNDISGLRHCMISIYTGILQSV